MAEGIDLKIMSRMGNGEFVEENLRHRLVEMLARMNEGLAESSIR
jgi:hypothetical protein